MKNSGPFHVKFVSLYETDKKCFCLFTLTASRVHSNFVVGFDVSCSCMCLLRLFGWQHCKKLLVCKSGWKESLSLIDEIAVLSYSVRWKMVLKTAVGPVFRWKIVRIVLFSPHPRTEVDYGWVCGFVCTCTTSCWYTHGQDIATPPHHMRLFLGNFDLMPIRVVTRLTLGVDNEFMNFDLKLINNPVVSWVLKHKEPSVLMHWKVENRILCYAEPLLWFCRSVECALDIADWYCPIAERWSSFRF